MFQQKSRVQTCEGLSGSERPVGQGPGPAQPPGLSPQQGGRSPGRPGLDPGAAGVPLERPLPSKAGALLPRRGWGGGAGEGQSGGLLWGGSGLAEPQSSCGTPTPNGRRGWAEALTAALDAGHPVIQGAGEPRCCREQAGGM